MIITKKVFFISLAVFVVVSVIGLVIAEKVKEETKFKDILRLAMYRKKGKPELIIFKMTSLTKFTWDKVYFFKRFTLKEDVEKTLSFKWDLLEKNQIDLNEDMTLVVFVKGGKVAEYLQYPGIEGIFDDSLNLKGYTPEEAVFEVKEVPEHGLVVHHYEVQNIKMDLLSIIKQFWRKTWVNN